jgi:hypothetical protein
MSHTNPQTLLSLWAEEFGQLEAALLHENGRARGDLNVQDCALLLGGAVRLFVAAGNASALHDDGPLPSLNLTPTDAVVGAAALLRDQSLTPFDLTLWFQRVASEAKKSNSFNEAAARAKVIYAERLALAGSIVE